MPFVTARESAPATNIDIKEEKASLERQLLEVTTKIDEAEKKRKKIKDVSAELEALEKRHTELSDLVLGATTSKKDNDEQEANLQIKLAKINRDIGISTARLIEKKQELSDKKGEYKIIEQDIEKSEA